jgi:hypothetical protein
VLRNKAQIFPGIANSVNIAEITVGPPQYQREDRYHRLLTVHYQNEGSADIVRFWLKFRRGIDELYPVLAACHLRMKQPIFPTPYFAGRCPDDDEAFLATAYVDGIVLRNRVIWLGAMRRTRQLEPIFRSNGAKMRQFHDTSVGPQAIAVTDIVDQARELTVATPYLSAEEREIVLARLARCQSLLPMTTLPAVLTHNDWILKNIIVTPDGTDYVIDCDSMKHRPTWRWFDIVYLLLNVESQRKWFPLVTSRMLCKLWRAFWRGYIGDVGVPDGLSVEELAAILYIVRIEWLVGGAVRPPYFEIISGPAKTRILRSLKRSVVRGHYSLFDFLSAS